MDAAGNATILTPTRTMSVVESGNNIQLSGDAASPGNSKYYGTDSAGTKGYNDLPGGLVGSYIARPSYKKMWALIPHHNTFHGIGTIASVAGTMVLEYVTGVSWSKFTTGSTAGNSVSAWTALSTTPEANPDINFVFKTNSSLADTRIWCGYCSAIPTSGGGDDPKGNSNAMIRFSQGVDTNWQLYTSDGVNSHVVDTGVVVAVSTTYTVRLWTTDYGTTWNCAVNGTTVNTTSNVPTLIGANTISLFTKANAGKSIWCQYGEGTHG